MATAEQARATIDDLYHVEGKAELIAGRIVPQIAAGAKPNLIAARICRSLDDHAEATGRGTAYSDNAAFVVPELSSGRESFSPDAAYYTGPTPRDSMRFLSGAPVLAVEVRSESDYVSGAESRLADKRADYFAAGTLVVWDVDTMSEQIHVYRADAPDSPITFGHGENAAAEPAVPGWQVEVDWIFK